MKTPYNADYIHHQDSRLIDSMRELVFGMEDGMVSTFGSITGIAIATSDPFTIILSGTVIIWVESVSMSVGTYLSSKSEYSIDRRIIEEEKEELKKYPNEEKEELYEIYLKEGWPKKLAVEMVEVASSDNKLFLKEMVYHELNVDVKKKKNLIKNSFVMLFSYFIGGIIPLASYFFLPVSVAIRISVIVTLIGLFVLGVFTTKYSKRKWWKAGLEMLVLAGVAGTVGYIVGSLVEGMY
ncbi:MAG: VIT1/CCC1 transporter family protein [Candidatus Magasanikbacteria bacterium]